MRMFIIEFTRDATPEERKQQPASLYFSETYRPGDGTVEILRGGGMTLRVMLPEATVARLCEGYPESEGQSLACFALYWYLDQQMEPHSSSIPAWLAVRAGGYWPRRVREYDPDGRKLGEYETH